MKKTLKDLQKEVQNLENELINIYYMSDAMVCAKYNVDYKDEAIEFIEEDIEILRDEIAKMEEKMLDPDADMERAMYHPAFRTEASFWIYKGY